MTPDELPSEQKKGLSSLLCSYPRNAAEEAASPMVSLEAVLLTSVIEAKEGRDVAKVDIPVVYSSADMGNE
eukprot:15194519-Ditylum_brightwellii.AAC.2